MQKHSDMKSEENVWECDRIIAKSILASKIE